ncbi:unnamed protein product [Arabis nemorensis]|uniref:Uncharacterized protein n=1 Tax=Arabis nemorensis TaxID=586526 RepID=A0A565BD88_9BRAS|nr:unnamed protein product [Arabis nemorensis]
MSTTFAVVSKPRYFCALSILVIGKQRPTMEWSTGLKIALGSAKGLSYRNNGAFLTEIVEPIKKSTELAPLLDKITTS